MGAAKAGQEILPVSKENRKCKSAQSSINPSLGGLGAPLSSEANFGKPSYAALASQNRSETAWRCCWNIADVPSILQDEVRYWAGQSSASVFFRFMASFLPQWVTDTEQRKQTGRIEPAFPKRSHDAQQRDCCVGQITIRLPNRTGHVHVWTPSSWRSLRARDATFRSRSKSTIFHIGAHLCLAAAAELCNMVIS